MKPVTHVIFDVDGLLLDTESLYYIVIEKICSAHGREFTWDLAVKQMGMTECQAAKELIDELDMPITADEFIKEVRDGMSELFLKAQLMPGADKLVRHLHKHNIPICLATGGHSSEFKLKTHLHGDLFKLFSHTVFSSDDPDVKHGKPAPDCFLVAAQRFQDSPSPDKVLVFEDAPNGVEGSLGAGMQVVWIPHPNVDRSKLKDRATLVLDSLEQFKPELLGLPPFEQ